MKPRYILDNNVLKTNPASRKEKNEHSSLLHPNSSLAIIASPDQIKQARKLLDDMPVPSYYIGSIWANVTKDLMELFEKKETPLSLFHLHAKNVKYVFWVQGVTDANMQKAEQRLHDLIDILKYVHFQSIEIRFYTHPGGVRLIYDREILSELVENAHKQLADEFEEMKRCNSKNVLGHTLYQCLDHALDSDQGVLYLLSDDISKDETLDQAAKLIKNRKNPDVNPLTILSLTDNDKSNTWFKEVSRASSNIYFVRNFHGERNKVAYCQGNAFPYSEGAWLFNQLFSAEFKFGPLTKAYPLTRTYMNTFLNRVLTKNEYTYYFNLHPKGEKYKNLLDQFFDPSGKTGQEIVEANKSKAVKFKAVNKVEDLAVDVEEKEAPSMKA